MAPAPEHPESFFLAPLDKCLRGRHRLVSWRAAFEALSDINLARSSRNVESFISDEAALDVLSRPFAPFQPSTPQTKADFETRTAAINITPSNDGGYDIEQIKEDVTWLSQRAKIDELQSTRLVVLEWQQRPSSRILQGYSEEEAISVQQAVGSGGPGASLLSGRALQPTRGQDEASFEGTERRRERILNLFLTERRAILGICLMLFVAGQRQDPETIGVQQSALQLPWLNIHGTRMRSLLNNKLQAAAKGTNFVSQAISAISGKLERFEQSSDLSDGLPAAQLLEDEHQLTVTIEILRILQLTYAHISSHGQSISPVGFERWFSFVDSHGFFERFTLPPSVPQDLSGPIRIMCSLITLSLLSLSSTLETLYGDLDASTKVPVCFEHDCEAALSAAMTNAADRGSSVASPALFAYSLICQTLFEHVQPLQPESPMEDDASGRGRSPSISRQITSNVPTAIQEIREGLRSRGPDWPLYLAQTAIDACGMFSNLASIAQFVGAFIDVGIGQVLETRARLLLLGLVRQGLAVANYSTDVVDAVLAIIGQRGLFESSAHAAADAVVRKSFLQDIDLLMPQLLYQAQSRYPYESGPMLTLCQALCLPVSPALSDELLLQLGGGSKFTHLLPRHFGGYELVDGHPNRVRLTSPLPLFLDRRWHRIANNANSLENALVVHQDEEESDLCLSRGTIGYLLNDTRPFVVMWDHDHSIFRYIGNLLATCPENSTRRTCSDEDNFDADTEADMIAFLATQLLASFELSAQREGRDAAEANSRARSILQDASDGLDRDQDVISLISEIFEEELSQATLQRQQETTGILTSCVRFFRATLKVQRSRVWSILSRSSLLSIQGQGEKLSSIVASIEMPLGRYNLLSECLALFEALVDDVITHAIVRTGSSTALVKRFDTSSLHPPTSVPLKVTSNVLSALTPIFLDVLSSSSGWNFAVGADRDLLNTRIITLFDRLVTYVYGYDDVQPMHEKLSAAIAPSAKQLVDTFLTQSPNTISTSPLFSILVAAEGHPLEEVFPQSATLATDLVRTALEFVTTLIDISIHLDTPTSHLEHQLFLALPPLTRLYVSQPKLKIPVISLLLLLVKSTDRTNKEPSSLLGHLGPPSAKSFLHVLQNLNRPLGDAALETRIWALMSAVVSRRQQWFASFLVTGETPKKNLTQKTDAQSIRKPSILDFALDEVSKAQSLYHMQPLAMLDFVSLAQNYFPWVTTTIHRHEQFLSTCLEYIGDLAKTIPESDTEKAFQNRSAAIVADILTMYLYNMRQLGDHSMLKTIASKLSFYREYAVTLPDYNTSLHTNLKRNFEKTFAKKSPMDFKQTIGMREFGSSYYYGIAFANQVLRSDPIWHGSSERAKNRGFANEFAKANTNLSLVESQIMLFTSWKTLAIELSSHLSRDLSLQKQLVNVVHQCLDVNSEPQPFDTVFESLIQHRIDLAMVLLQRLVDRKSDPANIKNLASAAWDAIRASNQDFEVAFTGENADYYRSLLRVLLLSLQPHTYITPPNTPEKQKQTNGSSPRASKIKAPETASILTEIAFEVVAKGFRSVATQLHNSSTSVYPSDIVLLTSILQTILRVRGIDMIMDQIALKLSEINVSRYAQSLYSWAGQLPSADEDPLYGELSMLFLRELSNIPSMAEFLATEGILAGIAAAPLTRAIQRQPNGSGPWTAPPRLYSIWAKGILPLALNVLVAVKDAFAAETATFLNMFPHQLARTASSLDGKSAANGLDPYSSSITLNEAAEVHTLALIALALARYRESPITAVDGGVPELLWDRADVKDDVEALVNGRRAGLRDRIMPTNEREEQLWNAEPLRKGGREEDSCQNRLEEMVLEELAGALTCLNGINVGR